MVELLAEKNNDEISSVTTFIPKLDPVSMFLLLPFMPAVLLIQLQMTMMNQLTQSSQMFQPQPRISLFLLE